MKPVVESLAEHVGLKPACEALGVPRSSRYAARRPRLASISHRLRKMYMKHELQPTRLKSGRTLCLYNGLDTDRR